MVYNSPAQRSAPPARRLKSIQIHYKTDSYMNVTIKTADEIAKMRIAGRLAAQVLEMITPHVVPGITTGELDQICYDYIVNEQKAIPAPLNYHGFPKSICTSINEVVCHGIPHEKKVLRDGDILNIDITVIKDEYHGDTSKMFHVGKPKPHNERLVNITQECLYQAIEIVKPGCTLGDIGHIIQKHAEANYYSIVREYCGHGIGKVFHEDPQVVHYGNKGEGMVIKEGMTFTIEPMLNAGKRHVKLNKKDGWTVTTKDGRASAQWEHTLAVTSDGVEVLTARPDEPFYRP
ncbi:type I methionyl aminopeptidase [Dasania marina]|uniref:type I methionyl aminopeptidase n=1 Tax=Dasania marina TaxID=471499 RepID=UPI0003712486|nr:type I methionyl aminopeptidase [Dasania marina]